MKNANEDFAMLIEFKYGVYRLNHKIVKNYIFTLMYQLLVLLVPLITAPYLARTLGPEGTGLMDMYTQ